MSSVRLWLLVRETPYIPACSCAGEVYLSNHWALTSFSLYICFTLPSPFFFTGSVFSILSVPLLTSSIFFIRWINCIPWSNPFSPTWFAGNIPLLSLTFSALISQGLMAPHKRKAHCKIGWLCFPLSVVCCAPGYLNGLPIRLTFLFEPTILVATKQVMNFKREKKNNKKNTITYPSGVIAVVK